MRRRVQGSLTRFFGERGSGIVSLSYDEILSLVGFESVHGWGRQLGAAHVKRVKQDWWKAVSASKSDKDRTNLATFLTALLPFRKHLLKYAMLFSSELNSLGTTPLGLLMYVKQHGVLPPPLAHHEKKEVPEYLQDTIMMLTSIKNSLASQNQPAEVLDRIQASIDRMVEIRRTS